SRAPRALCRFAAQKPGRRQTGISDLLTSLSAHARSRIVFSGVKLGNPPVVAALKDSKVPVEFIGNGWDGGNGELTMVLDELAEKSEARGWLRVGNAFQKIRLADQRSQARQRYASYADFLSGSRVVWASFNFVHYKAWQFDHEGLWLGSANPTEDAFSGFYESGIYCLDAKLAEAADATIALDMANSIPIRSENVDRR
ncbi:MAG: hypothetical protein HY075_15725, partial [Deltaproteobacteria bacterium]|nr:hypothetical protein [Deltaproteobacteria bacterium]